MEPLHEQNKQGNSADMPENPSINGAELFNKGASFLQEGLDTATKHINKLTGEEASVKIRLCSLFSAVFKKHTRGESEDIFAVGTLKTTPKEEDIISSWPKPWLFSRIFLMLTSSFLFLYVLVSVFKNPFGLPAFMFLGALAAPFSMLFFFFETNVPQNISIFEVIKMFAVGGGFSLVITMVLFSIVGNGGTSVLGSYVVGLVEECGKIAVACLFVQIMKPKYILNGLLIGAAIGAGFAAFETAGYAFAFGGFKVEAILDIILMRAWMSIGTHTAWAAISCAGLMVVKGDAPFTFSMLSDKRFLSFLIFPILMHGTWNSEFFKFLGELKFIILILVAWAFLFVLLHAGLRQIRDSFIRKPAVENI